jgi:carbonic anhydrase
MSSRETAATDELLENAKAYEASFDKGDLPLPPAKKVAIVACMDARLNPYGLLGLTEGDAHVIRNAGGVITDDEIRSLAISQHLLGTEEIILIHHTDCGMLTFTDDEFARQLEQEGGQRPEWSARTFADLEEDVRDSIRRITKSPFIPRKEGVRGFVYDVKTGGLSEVT